MALYKTSDLRSVEWPTSRGGVSRQNPTFAGRNLESAILQEAAALELAAAQTFGHNNFKVELAKRTIEAVVMQLAEEETTR